MASDSPQSQSDAEIRQKIVGTWIFDLDEIKGTETYFADGRYTSVATINYGHTNEVQSLVGTWGVTNGILTARTPNPWKDYKVVRVDDHELVMQWNARKSGGPTFTTKQKRKL